jgi:hypothetical protein
VAYGNATNPNGYTFFYVARYAPQQASYLSTSSCASTGSHGVNHPDKRNRIFSSLSGNWLSGFWNCAPGVAFHEGWLTQADNAVTEMAGSAGNNWLLGADCGYVASTPAQNCSAKYRAFGSNKTINVNTDTTGHQVVVNTGAFNEYSDFQIAEVISYPTNLPMSDVVRVETYLARKYGITLTTTSATKLGIHRSSLGTSLNEPFAVQPQIAIQDTNGQTRTTDNSTIVTATVTGLNGRTIGITSADAVQGVATFENLGVDGLPNNSYTITYSSNTGLATTSETRTFTRGGGSETDTALSLNGSTQYIEKSDITGSPYDIPGDITLQAWVYPSTDCIGDQAVVAKLNSYMLYCGGNGVWKYVFDSDGISWAGSESAVKVRKNEWHHIAYVKSGTTLQIFMDGNAVQSITGVTATMGGNNDAFQIGRFGTSSYFQGEIDEVRVYRSARTQSQIQSDMHNYGPISDSNLVAYYDFNESGGTTLYNRAMGATSVSDMVITGSPAWTDVKSVNTTHYSAYTSVRFDRTYITSAGGWSVPANVSAVSALIVAGGGGGGWNSGGGGGGGGFLTLDRVTISGVIPARVGMGGRGGQGPDNSGIPTFIPTAGETSTFGSTLVTGGNRGGVYNFSSLGGSTGGVSITTSTSTSGAGGAGASASGTSASGGGAGLGSVLESPTISYYSMGGGGGGWSSAGGAPGGATVGAAGAATTAAGSGGGNTTQLTGISALGGTGGGGGASAGRVDAGNGGSGVIIIRWITASKPIFTQPQSDTTTAGLTDTITVSANPLNPLTRNYRWQVSTDTGTTWANASTGSGLTSNTYTTPILETATSGSRFQYRVVVTDSDTAGLFIIDTSVAVFIVVNARITFTGSYTIQKYGDTHQDTFTALSGTGNKTFSYSPNNRAGITWSSPTANTAVLSIGSTLFVGTYLETITATDTRGAQTSFSLAIIVTKADTITVTTFARTETYTGSTLNFTPTFSITGLKNSDTITAAAMSWNYNGIDNSGTVYTIQPTRPTNAGSYTITPVAPASLTDSYTAVSIVTAALTVNRATRSISITPPGSPIKFGDTRTVTSTPSAGAGDGSITYATSTTDSCTVSSTTVTAIKSSGSCSFTAMISRGNNFETATSTAGTSSLTKADTLTVTVNAMTPLTYTGAQIGITPSVAVSGLKLTNSVGATPATIRYASTGASSGACASGGTCLIGDTGPGGGIVFYDAGSQQSWGRYLEIAKSGWNGAGETTARWCSSALASTALNVLTDGIGQGLANSTTIASACGEGAAFISRNYNGGGKTNWYLPTPAEFSLMYSSRGVIDLSQSLIIWLSTEPNDANKNWVGVVGALSSPGTGGNNKNDILTFRPIRAFAAGETAQNFVLTKPTDADSYTVRASGLNLSSGSLSDYQGVTYLDATLRINRAQQAQLFLAEYGAIFGTPYKVIVFGGSGTGVAKVSTASGSATGCNVSGETLTSTSVGTCLLTTVKSQDKNYETATVTISVYFLQFTAEVPLLSIPSAPGPGIALTGETPIIRDPHAAPTITSVGSSGDMTYPVAINGAGFSASTAANTTIKFWRNQVVNSPDFIIKGDTLIWSKQPVGATKGRLLVINSNGSAASIEDFTPIIFVI